MRMPEKGRNNSDNPLISRRIDGGKNIRTQLMDNITNLTDWRIMECLNCQTCSRYLQLAG